MAKKLSPYEAFINNIHDAQILISYAKAFKNNRARRMRQELRMRVGSALKVPANRRESMDCLESDDLFLVFKPEGKLNREQFSDLQPLLRQSVVVACAAFEVYLADKAMVFASDALRRDKPPSRMMGISLTVGDWTEIEKKQRRGWGIRAIIEKHIREESSTAPNKIGFVLSTVGVKDWEKKVDNARRVEKGTTNKELEKITALRNRIAHGSEKKGQGAAKIEEFEGHIRTIEAVVHALEKEL